MKKTTLLCLLNSIIITSLTCTITNLTAALTPMEQDGTVVNKDSLPERMAMNIYLVAKNKQSKVVVTKLSARMFQPDITNALNYQIDKSIIKSLSTYLKEKGKKIASDKIFQLAAKDSIQKEFHHGFWEFDKDSYTIILPAPYIDGLQWKKASDFKAKPFQSLWKTARSGVNYYLDAYQNKIWPLRSWSDAVAYWGSPLK
jgi:hypothetical protein